MPLAPKKYQNVGRVYLSSNKQALVVEFYRKNMAANAIQNGERMVIHLDAIVKVIARQWDKTSIAIPV